jgi:hypothetical protein
VLRELREVIAVLRDDDAIHHLDSVPAIMDIHGTIASVPRIFMQPVVSPDCALMPRTGCQVRYGVAPPAAVMEDRQASCRRPPGGRSHWPRPRSASDSVHRQHHGE